VIDIERFRIRSFVDARPAMLAGVPMIPLLVVSGAFLLVTMWCVYLVSPYVAMFLAVIYVPILLTMRQVTRRTISACTNS